MKNRAYFSQGFTLIEVMVVVVILAILAAMVVPKIMNRPDEARVTRAKSDLQGIASAMELYRLDNFSYPTTDQGLEALVRKPANLPANANWQEGGYLPKVPEDPWGIPYHYLQPGVHGEYDIYSTGADAQSGGDKINADIGNWDLG